MIEVLKQALRAFEVATTPLAKDRQEVLEAVAAIKQAIKELESQEPDYWLGYGLQAHTEKPFDNATALYTHPPQRTWVGLTDKEFHEACWESYVDPVTGECSTGDREYAVRWTEAKLKDKNS
jgi:hypothetical protein